MKLLFITTNIQSSGGVSRVLSLRCDVLVKHYAYEIVILNTYGKVDELFYQFHPDIRFLQLKNESLMSRGLSYSRQLRSVINSERPNVIVNCDNGLKGSLLPFFIKNKRTLIYEDHTSANSRGSTIAEKLKIKFTRLFHSYFNSEYAAVVRVNTKTNSKNSIVIPNPIFVPHQNDVSNHKSKIVVAVGRYAPEKDYSRLIRIWQNLLNNKHDWVLKIYGEGKHDDLDNLIGSLGIQKNVELHGPSRAINEVFKNASILVNTSKFESFGLSILEGMSHGLAVISFENEGANVIIENGENGFLIEPGNEHAFNSQLYKLMENTDLRKKLGENGRAYANSFTPQNNARMWHELLQSLNPS